MDYQRRGGNKRPYQPQGYLLRAIRPTLVMYVETGVVRLSVLSHAGKEAVVAVLHAGHFFGERPEGHGAMASEVPSYGTRRICRYRAWMIS
jgi:CRP-like cAMP-binding protein